MQLYPRILKHRVAEALLDTPVVLVIGPRRTGKTTLVREFEDPGRTYITLDNLATREAAQSDPTGFVRGLHNVIIDEVQRVPELLLAIKQSVDEGYRPGRFLLTGSSNVMNLPRVADSLAGRIETLRLLPLAQAEIQSRTPTFLKRLFDGKFQSVKTPAVGEELVRTVLTGGFPEALVRKTEQRQQAWARSWLAAVISRDLREVAEVRKPGELPRFVRLLAEHAGQLVNYSRFGSHIGISYKTGQRYVSLLEQVFIVTTLSPWHSNRLKRLTRTPKLQFLDSGLLAAGRGINLASSRANRKPFGAVLESFVFS